MTKGKTNFEQVPVEVVKKITEADLPIKKKINNHIVTVENPAKKTEPYSIGVRNVHAGI
jgi:glucose/arabinose dehydrogenase